MSSRLPDYVDPSRLCEAGRTFEGRIALKEFQRLTPLLASTEGEAAFTLVFARDRDLGLVVRGSVRAEPRLVCQRCLGAMPLPVDSTFVLGLVHGPDEAARLPEALDPLMLGEGELVPRDLIEDEILLAIPPAPMHPEEDCEVDLAQVNRVENGACAEDEPVESDNPFAVLRGLRDGED